MPKIDYNRFMSSALQRMIGDVLSEVAENGLQGNHHFYIRFKSDFHGVVVPAHLKAQFPDEMTIVMQEWFDNLGVMDDRFCVTLSFGGKAEDLVIPFESIVSFADPSVNFSLEFEETDLPVKTEPEDDDEIEGEVTELKPAKAVKVEKNDEDGDTSDAEVIQFSDFRRE